MNQVDPMIMFAPPHANRSNVPHFRYNVAPAMLPASA
jgi:hypothetical protein